MTKILSGVMGIVMTGAVVTASAYALWSAQATVSGFNFETGSLSLLVSKDNSTFENSINVSEWSITNAFPGQTWDDTLWLQNDSSEPLAIQAQLVSADVWDANLAEYVELAAVPQGETLEEEDYKTLNEWNTTPQVFAGELPADTTISVQTFLRLSEDAPSSVQNAMLENVTFTITGTQVAL